MRVTLRAALRRALRHAHGELLALPFLSGKTLPITHDEGGYVLPPPAGWGASATGDDGLPVPPNNLWLGYADTPQDFLDGGRRDTSTMLGLLRRAGASPEAMTRVLDLGCGAGRMLRFFPGKGAGVERWGADISARHIAWCQEHLDPPFHFVTTSTTPHLPFADGYFDLVYAASLFTHIADLPDAWFLEILRVVRPDGYAYITLHDEHSVAWLRVRDPKREGWAPLRRALETFDRKTSVLSRAYSVFSIGHGPDAQVFHNLDALTRRWGRLARVVSITPEAHDHQTALLMRRELGR
ncbi:MAG TPA: class I SAM-dependent methyltransferase [Gemmatimonadaceae bacterium]|nr:class I SAM-dependent methyltransferase [Gemmatimonadaceae bacterium]